MVTICTEAMRPNQLMIPILRLTIMYLDVLREDNIVARDIFSFHTVVAVFKLTYGLVYVAS